MVWGGDPFFNDTLKKYVIVFGKTFENTTIIRETSNTTGGNSTNKVETTVIKVPLTYAAKDKMFVRLTQDPNLDRPESVLLPRMSFEIAGGFTYDSERKRSTIRRNVRTIANNNNAFLTQYEGVPYNIPFNLYIYSKFQQDAAKILEPILAFFAPEFTPSVQLIPEMDMTMDIPIVIGQPRLEDTFDGKATDRRLLIWTVPFTLKGYFYGPKIKRPVIKFTHVNVFADLPYSNIGIGLPISEFCNSTQMTVSLYNSGVGASLPQVGNSTTPYFARMDNELVIVTAGFGTNTLTISRGEANTLANAHNQGITFVGVASNNFSEWIYGQPGLLANGAATNSVNASLNWTNISIFDDYGYATEIYAANSQTGGD